MNVELLAVLVNFLSFWLWPWLAAVTIVVHLIIGRKTFIKWMEALGWNGIMALGANIRDILRGAPVQQIIPPNTTVTVTQPPIINVPATIEESK